jgi:predicted NBD/HSP70 family sugar kinase
VFEGSGWNALGQLLEASAAADPVARGVVDELVQYLGASLGGLVNLTGPERVVLGGWVGLRLMEFLGERIEDEIRARSLARPGSQFELRSASFGGDTVALGAAILPLERLIFGP